MGGIFKAKSFYDDNGVEHAFMLVWGSLTKDAVTTPYNKVKSECTIRYYSDSFMKCEVWGDYSSPLIRIMGGLEKGDIVLCAGIWTNKPYKTKKGEEKHSASLVCDIVIPMAMINYLVDLYGSDNLQKILNSGEADKFESLEEEEQENNSQDKTNTNNYDSSPAPDGFESIDESLPF